MDAVIVGADRIAANGDVANKIGTYPLALAARRTGIPFVVAAPESTVDRSTAAGEDIAIEERDPAEVLTFAGARTAPEGAAAYNPAFDVTPADLVTAIVTEDRVIDGAPVISLAGASVVVTGASGGIGAAIARGFAAVGAQVVVHYHR